MNKHIGIVACSAEGVALCYLTICAETKKLMGGQMHPEITLHPHAMGKYMRRIQSGGWRQVADLMLSSARKLEQCGAG